MGFKSFSGLVAITVLAFAATAQPAAVPASNAKSIQARDGGTWVAGPCASQCQQAGQAPAEDSLNHADCEATINSLKAKGGSWNLSLDKWGTTTQIKMDTPGSGGCNVYVKGQHSIEYASVGTEDIIYWIESALGAGNGASGSTTCNGNQEIEWGVGKEAPI